MSHSTHNLRHFKDESFQAIICTGTDNTNKTYIVTLYTINIHKKTQKTQKPKFLSLQ